MRRKKIFSIMIVCAILFLLIKCNIFDWTTSSEDELFYEGVKLFNEKKFTEAKEKFAEAMESDPYRSDYRYYHAKATIFESDLNYFSIAREIIDADQSGELYLPLYSRPLVPVGQDSVQFVRQENQEKNQLYGITCTAHDDLHPIYLEETHGEIQPNDIWFGYSILSYARALLQLRDTNNDGQINEDDFYLSIKKIIVGDSTVYVIDNLDNFVAYLLTDYQTFNSVLSSSVLYIVDGSVSIYKASGDTTLFNNDQLNEIMDTAESVGNYYMVNDGKDNDDDGRIDEEILNGKDDDGDGLIDEDSHL